LQYESDLAKKRPPEPIPAAFTIFGSPHWTIFANFFLRRTEMVSFSNSYEKRTLETHNNGNYKADSVSGQSATKRRRQNLSQK
jgi:hypothetical protein